MFKKLAYYSAYTFVRWQFLVFLLLGSFAFYYLKSNYISSETLLSALVRTFGKVVLVFMVILTLTCLLSTIFSWVLLKISSAGWLAGLQVRFGAGLHATAGPVPVSVEVPSVYRFFPGPLRPLLGSVSARLVFTDLSRTDMILLDQGVRDEKSFWRRGITGTRAIELHDRKEYHIERVQLVVRDMFHFFALPLTVPYKHDLYTTPPGQDLKKVPAYPNKSEEQTERIPTPKRVEGEYINYKDFEPGDDVRRIVWKIYGRTRQLVVRIPETTDPYASHIYFYASFYQGKKNGVSEVFGKELLNCYKDQVSNLFDSVKTLGLEVRLLTDQDDPKNFEVTDEEKPLYHISVANWQGAKPLREFVNLKDAAVVCLSPMIPLEDIESFLEACPPNLTVAFITLSKVFEWRRVLRFSDLFIVRRKDPLDAVTRRWVISSSRRRLLRNEKAIIQLLKKSELTRIIV